MLYVFKNLCPILNEVTFASGKMQERTFKRLGWKSWCIKSTLVARLNVNFFIAYPVVFVLSEADGGLWLKVAEETAGRNETAGPAPEATAGLRVEPAAMLTGTNWTGPAPPGHQGEITDSSF